MVGRVVGDHVALLMRTANDMRQRVDVLPADEERRTDALVGEVVAEAVGLRLRPSPMVTPGPSSKVRQRVPWGRDGAEKVVSRQHWITLGARAAASLVGAADPR